MELKPGEMICDACDGEGNTSWIELPTGLPEPDIFSGTCDKCHGFGKLDWIENVVGKKPSQIVPQYIHSLDHFPTNANIGDMLYNRSNGKLYSLDEYNDWIEIVN